MFQKFKRGLSAASVAVVSAVAVAPAQAAIDTTAVEAYISTDITTALTAIGVAVISLAALSMGFKWIKGMLFG